MLPSRRAGRDETICEEEGEEEEEEVSIGRRVEDRRPDGDLVARGDGDGVPEPHFRVPA